MSREELINIIRMVAVFGLVFSLWCICIIVWLGQSLTRLKIVRKRLGIGEKETDESRVLRLWREMHKDTKGIKLSKESTFQARLEKLSHDTGWRTPIQTVILGVVGVAILAFATTYMLGGGVILGLGISVAIVTLFWVYTQRRISKRAALFDKQFLDALGISARALRAGHPLVGAFQLVSEEIGEPLGTTFAHIYQEQALGMDLQDSIRKMANTTHNAELRLFATSVAIQLRSGGNLADLMDSLASVMRARVRFNRRVRVLTAQTQLSKKILISLPIVLFFMLNVISPQYMAPFYTTWVGRFVLGVTGMSVLLGAWLMGKLSVLRF